MTQFTSHIINEFNTGIFCAKCVNFHLFIELMFFKLYEIKNLKKGKNPK